MKQFLLIERKISKLKKKIMVNNHLKFCLTKASFYSYNRGAGKDSSCLNIANE